MSPFSMRIKADLLLLFVALLWGSAFAVMRVAAQYDIVFLLNGSRFLLGGLLILPFIRMKETFSRRNIHLVFLAGFALFSAVTFQQLGLKTTTASNAGFITILYVVIVPAVLWIGWGEQPALKIWMAVAAALLGGFLLSTGGTYRAARGDLLVFFGSFFWAMHVIVIGKAQGRISLLSFACSQYLVCGTLSVVVGAFLEKPSFAIMGSLLPAVLYTAVLSIAVGFTLQVFAQHYTPENDASLILSMEAVFAALFGFIFLGEVLSPIQIIGCALIITAVIVVQFGGGKIFRRRKT